MSHIASKATGLFGRLHMHISSSAALPLATLAFLSEASS